MLAAMSVATVAPGAIEVTFAGRFGFGIYRWAYLPFDVPAGVRRIRMERKEFDAHCARFARLEVPKARRRP
jgi:hypothetical protein